MDKKTLLAIINCYLEPESEDRESVNEYLINAGIDFEKFRKDMLKLLSIKQRQTRRKYKGLEKIRN